METFDSQIEETATAEVAPTDLDAEQAGAKVSQYQENRLRRILDYQAAVLQKKDHLEAVLGTVNAGLMGVTIQMDEFIEGALAASPKTAERVQKLLPSIQTYLQATRQIDRLAQVELRVAAARKGKSTGKDDKPTKPR
ncbi:MAG: hypothetical protein H8E44_40255 [Planctomycetes bacterium]|nr:hypothetical protein [Planctomycetota bacterium]